MKKIVALRFHRCFSPWSANLSLTIALATFFLFLAGMVSSDAYAYSTVPDGTCTTDPQFYIVLPPNGFISYIIALVRDTLSTQTSFLFNNIAKNVGQAVQYALTLFIMIYGIAFSLGLIQLSVHDFLIRASKIGFISIIMSSSGWSWFADDGIIGGFFNGGTDELIGLFSGVMSGFTGGGAAFDWMDQALAVITSSRMWVTLMAIIFTGPYGVLFGILIIMGVITFSTALFQALWVYLLSLTIRMLMFGMAPIFIPCMLFSKTRHLFDGWLGQIINSVLQPIFLFTFFGFFAQIVYYLVIRILSIPVCWTAPSESISGTPFDVHFWRFTVDNDLYTGAWNITGGGGGLVFPISTTDALMFIILTQITWRFNGIVSSVASEIAGGSTLYTRMGGFGDGAKPQMGANTDIRGRNREALADNTAPAGAAGGARKSGGLGGPGTRDQVEVAQNTPTGQAQAFVETFKNFIGGS